MKVQNVIGAASALLVLGFLGGCSQQEASAAVPAAVAVVAVQAPPAVCSTCGIVRSVTALSQDGRGTGAGAVIGGIVGGVAGNQVGGGSGRQIATVAGVIGGAVLGNEIEQNRNAASSFEVVVDMENGSQQIITLQDAGSFRAGSRVKVQGGSISLQ